MPKGEILLERKPRSCMAKAAAEENLAVIEYEKFKSTVP